MNISLPRCECLPNCNTKISNVQIDSFYIVIGITELLFSLQENVKKQDNAVQGKVIQCCMQYLYGMKFD